MTSTTQQSAVSTPPEILKMLRQREGLDANDSSKDDALDALTPDEKFRNVIAWQFGDGAWSGTILSWAAQCGVQLDIK
ncbi:hypothetical protein ACK249_003644 [Pseudomonas aeruginosa]|uniref:hypothetical protein n=1 Tax=Pseudomonas aeruginosa TaxID=287 RepID=UPI00155F289D|nr:hypothetical protein [Pseudomonas aeruginosa]EIU2701757.1 hypothetical protein [Pseudomonas aeruginosa]EKW9641089.1 hypothetical protein [Pseudomonas aeruginosa]NRC34108.1 hypothetical protein [Pseudomonas aeruginosa]